MQKLEFSYPYNFYQKDIMGLHYYTSLKLFFTCIVQTYNSHNSGISGGPGEVVGAAELRDPWGGGGGGGGGGQESPLFHTTHTSSC